ncbi:MAG: pilus assembly PilX N-terminal domain-containing protein [Gemmatimonadetes bacterium]|nr:pilus assembly PilX N-terminal domain-containing protein [Gemmatimonadota bacterium]
MSLGCRRVPTRSSSATGPRARRGFALEVVLLMLVMFSIVVLAGLSAVTTMARTSNADYRGARAGYAAEGGADDIMSQLDAAMQDGIISGSDIAAITTPQMPGYLMSQQTQTMGVPVSRTITSGPFSGLYSLNQPIDIQVTARDSSGNRAKAVLSVNAQTIPLFQFGVFYEEDLEILPGAPMTFAGWVHTNGNLYLSSNSATFQSNITTPDSVFWQRKEQNQRLSGVWINNAAGTPVRLDFDSRSHAGATFKARSEQLFNGRLMNNSFGVKPLKLPLPAGTPAITLVEPRSAGDNAMVQSVKMAWKSDWYITVNAAVFNTLDTNTMKSVFCDSMVQVRAAGLTVPSSGACGRIFKPRRNAFYEGREDLRPDLIDIHIDSLRIWSDSVRATRAPRIIYINVINNNTTANNDYVAVRLRQGARLPLPATNADTGGLTIATDRPVYVLGNYNTTVWRPAAILGDAITFLSQPPNANMDARGSWPAASRCGASGVTGWCDTLQTAFAQRTARPTTVNAALLAGHSATPCDYARAGCAAPPYGGGLENFPRFLENWGGVTFRYTGSLVSLFRSRYGVGLWGNSINVGYGNGAYYSAPTRQWSFDVNFRFPERLPPGTPSVGTVLQTAFRPLY